MGENQALAVIVARSGPLREGIEALLASLPDVEIVGETDLAPTALRIAAGRQVDVLVLDVGLPGVAVQQVLESCRRGHPRLRCIALADNAEQERTARELGADAVFIKGFPADRFVETVESLVSRLNRGS